MGFFGDDEKKKKKKNGAFVAIAKEMAKREATKQPSSSANATIQAIEKYGLPTPATSSGGSAFRQALSNTRMTSKKTEPTRRTSAPTESYKVEGYKPTLADEVIRFFSGNPYAVNRFGKMTETGRQQAELSDLYEERRAEEEREQWQGKSEPEKFLDFLMSGAPGTGAVGSVGKIAQPIATKGASALRTALGLTSKIPQPIRDLGLVGTVATGGEMTRGAIDPKAKEQTKAAKAGASLRAGVGDVVSLTGSDLEMRGQKDRGERLKKIGAGITEGFESESTPGFRPLDPDWYATNFARTAPLTAAIIAAMLPVYKATGGAAGKLGLGTFGKHIVGTLFGSAGGRQLEGELEAAGTYEEALARGMSEEDAFNAAMEVKAKNQWLMGMDAAELGTALLPAGKPAASMLGRLARGGIKTAGVGAMEAGEEGLQEVFSRQALGDKTPALEMLLRPDEEMKEAMGIGGIFGIGLGGAGHVYRGAQRKAAVDDLANQLINAGADEAQARQIAESQVDEYIKEQENLLHNEAKQAFQNIKMRIRGKIPPQSQATFDTVVDNYVQSGMEPEAAELKAFDDLAETDVGKEIIDAAMQEIVAEEAEKQTIRQAVQTMVEPVQEEAPRVVEPQIEPVSEPAIKTFKPSQPTPETTTQPKPATPESGEQAPAKGDVAEEGLKASEGLTERPGEKIEEQPVKFATDAETLRSSAAKVFKIDEGELTSAASRIAGEKGSATVTKEHVNKAIYELRGKKSAEPATEKPAKEAFKEKADTTKRKKAADKLRKTADNMQRYIDEKRAPRLANTNRRARMAASATADADHAERIQGIMRNLADAIEAGEAKRLSNVSSKAHVEMLESLLRSAKHNAHKDLRYDEVKGLKATIEDIEHAKYPEPGGHKSNLRDLINDIKGVKGIGKERAKVERLINNSGSETYVKYGDSFNAVEKLAKAAQDKGKISATEAGWIIGTDGQSVKRLKSIGVNNLNDLKAALKEYFTFREGTGLTPEQVREREITKLEHELVGAKFPGYFPTPKAIAERMVEMADIQPGEKVLEPSAGKGNIADVIKENSEGELSVIEIVPKLREVLKAKGHNIIADDFLEHQGGYDKIIMNPPFENMQDAEHIRHAYSLLKPGGKLVSISSPSPFFRGDKKANEFREWLNEVDGVVEDLPEGSFKSADRPTGVATKLVTIEKPAEVAKPVEPKTPKVLIKGKEASVKTEKHTEVKVHYAVVDIDDLAASHDTDLKVNKDYPQELQPRDRTRAATELQVNNIINNLEPEWLGENPKASEGAPIVGADMVVEAGNGRVIALKRGYEESHANIEKYKSWLVDNAEEFGLNKDAVEKLDNPILVRIRDTDIDRTKFAEEANISSVSAMSATEQAVADAKKLSGGMLSLFRPSESGEILTLANREFVDSFMRDVVDKSERSRYITADGNISQEGATRVRNAVFAKAYGDITAIEKLSESTDNNIKNITNAMLAVAPEIVKLKEGISEGIYYDLDIAEDIAQAANKLSNLRETGESVDNYLRQQSMFGEDISPEAKALLSLFDGYKRSTAKIARLLMGHIEVVKNIGAPNQTSLFEKEVPTKAEVLTTAIKGVEGAYDYKPRSLFEGETASSGQTSANDAQEIPTESKSIGAKEESSEITEQPKTSSLDDVQARLSKKVDEAIGDITPQPGLSIRIVGEAKGKPLPKGKSKRFAYSDPDIQERIDASHGVKGEPILAKLHRRMVRFANQLTREYERLPKTSEFAPLRNALLKLSKQKGVQSDKTIRSIQGITKGNNLNADQYYNFEQKVLLDDLMEEAKLGHELPFGFAPDTLEDEWNALNEWIADDKEIQEALADRADLWGALKPEYIQSMKDIGFNVEDRLTREHYFRHQVLALAETRHNAVKGTGGKVKTPTGRGHLKKREGSTFDINTSYIEAEFEVMAQMRYDIEVAKTIKLVDEQYNIADDLKKEAKKKNEAATMPYFQKMADKVNAELPPDAENKYTAEDMFRRVLNKKIAIGFSNLKKADIPEEVARKYPGVLDKGGTGDTTMKMLSEIMNVADPDSDAYKAAATIFKGIREKQETIKSIIGKKYVDPKNIDELLRIAPEGYTDWQPREGNVFYFADTIPAHLAEQLHKHMLGTLAITEDDLQQVLVRGAKRKQFIIKEEVKETVDGVIKAKPELNAISQFVRSITTSWKVWTLTWIRRIIPYNLRNVSGDLEAVATGNPDSIRYTGRAMRELYDVFAGDKSMTSDMKDWFERGGMQTLLQAQELGDLGQLRIFKHLVEQSDKIQKLPLRAWKAYWRGARLATDYREAILRYASYLSYLEQMQKNDGKPKNFGASRREEIMALEDVKDRAFWLSNQLLGAYDQVGVIGQWLADFGIPFYRWMEVNMRRYYRLMANVARDDRLAGAVGRKLLVGVTVRSPLLVLRVGRFAIKATALWALLIAWNMLKYPDEEKELPEDVRNKPHLIYGRNADGTVRYIGRLGALSDLLDWFAVDVGTYDEVQDWLNGDITIQEAAVKMATAPANKLINAINPLIKNTGEAIAGLQFFPDVTKPRPIRDRMQYLAQSLALGDEYSSLAGKPTKGYVKSLENILSSGAEPGQSAYYETKDLVREYGKELGKGNFDFSGISRSKKSNALYNFKLAIRYGDKEAADKYLLEYAMNGGTEKGLEQSLRALHPLWGLKSKAEVEGEPTERDRFVAQLTPEEREVYDRAIEYYEDVLLGNKGQDIMASVERQKEKLEKAGQ